MLLDIFFLSVSSILVFLISKDKENMSELLNIYNEPLKACGDDTMSNGSWDSSGKCSELGGGVHQICVKNISKKTPNFSMETGQSSWSNERGNDNHCVCLGAWALYAKKKPANVKKVLKCDAIPKVAFSKQYVSKFNTWNGEELPNQIVDGVTAMYKNCLTNNKSKNNALKQNYCNFAKNVSELKNSKLYSDIC